MADARTPEVNYMGLATVFVELDHVDLALEGGWTVLMMMACKGQVDAVRYLLQHGAAVDRRDDSSQTALHMACNGGRAAVVKVLLDHGADIAAADNNGLTPVLIASLRGHHDVVAVLVAHERCDFDAGHRSDPEQTPLLHACFKGHERVVQRLLEAGSEPDMGLLMRLVDKSGHPQCARQLEAWSRAYLLVKARRIRDAVTSITDCTAPVSSIVTRTFAEQRRVHAAPAYLRERVVAGRTLPGMDFQSLQQQQKKPAEKRVVKGKRREGKGRARGDVEQGLSAAMVVAQTLAQLNGELFVDLMELVGITYT